MERFKVLIAESDMFLAKHMILMLKHSIESNIQIKIAKSVKKAIELSNTFYPDLIIINYDLSDGGIIRFLKWLNARFFRLLIVTSKTSQNVNALTLSGLSFITKPVDLMELIEGIDEVMDMTSIKEFEIKKEVLFHNALLIVATKMYLSNENEVAALFLEDIICIHSYVGGAEISLKNKQSFKITVPLRRYEEVLKQYNFVRCGCSIINMKEVTHIDKENRTVHLTDGLSMKITERPFEQLSLLFNNS